MPNLLFDLSAIDLDRVIFDASAIEQVNPQRGDMRHLDGICWVQPPPETGPGLAGVGFKDTRPDEFWVPGHIPGRPLLPGVLMIEAAAQLAAFMIKQFRDEQGFLGFVGCDAVKFRGQVEPGQRLHIIGQETRYRAGRQFTCQTQGVCEGQVVFEGIIRGMAF
jgi:3-hydroxyacyl-[acyl-carrier-protein] dehydratase